MDPKRKEIKIAAMRAVNRCSIKKCGGPVEGTRKDQTRQKKIMKKIEKTCEKTCEKTSEKREQGYWKCVEKKSGATKSDKEFLKRMEKEYKVRLRCRQKKCKPEANRLFQAIWGN